jgi:hypothetical protein
VKPWLANAIAFFGGAAIATATWALVSDAPVSGSQEQQRTLKLSPGAVESVRAKSGVSDGVDSSERKSTLTAFATQPVFLPGPGESLREEFQRLLREMLHGRQEERDDCMALLLARLENRGADRSP